MSVLEKDIEGKASEYAESIGYISLKVRVTGQRGWPDHVFINPHGYHVWIEFKKLKKKPTKLQNHRLKQLWDNNVEAWWTDDYTRAKDILDAAVASTRLSA